jgi:hypothetical protein
MASSIFEADLRRGGRAYIGYVRGGAVSRRRRSKSYWCTAAECSCRAMSP